MNAQARTNARNRRVRRALHRAVACLRRNLRNSVKTAEAVTGGKVSGDFESHAIAMRVLRRFLSA